MRRYRNLSDADLEFIKEDKKQLAIDIEYADAYKKSVLEEYKANRVVKSLIIKSENGCVCEIPNVTYYEQSEKWSGRLIVQGSDDVLEKNRLLTERIEQEGLQALLDELDEKTTLVHSVF